MSQSEKSLTDLEILLSLQSAFPVVGGSVVLTLAFACGLWNIASQMKSISTSAQTGHFLGDKAISM